MEFNGKQYPPLYTPRNSTLMELFDITDDEVTRLKTIITKEEAQARHAEREHLRRQRSGAMDRATYLETAEHRRVEAQLRRARGESLRQIAEALGVSHEGVRKMLKG